MQHTLYQCRQRDGMEHGMASASLQLPILFIVYNVAEKRGQSSHYPFIFEMQAVPGGSQATPKIGVDLCCVHRTCLRGRKCQMCSFHVSTGRHRKLSTSLRDVFFVSSPSCLVADAACPRLKSCRFFCDNVSLFRLYS